MKALLTAIIKPLAWLFGAWLLRFDAKRDQRRNTALQAAEAYAKTRKDMDNAEADLGSDPAVLREWLRERGKQ
jgi:hypothetical protein